MIDSFHTKKWYISSTGEGLSLTIQGLSIGGLVVAASAILKLFGIDIQENELTNIIGGSVILLSLILSGIGLVRKLYYHLKPLIG